MPCWPLSLPKLAVSPSPLCSHHSSSSLAVELPSRHPLPSRRAVHHHRVAAHCCRSRLHSQSLAVTLASSLAVPCCCCAIAPSLAAKLPSHHPLPSRCSVRHRQVAVHRHPSPFIAVNPSIAGKLMSCRPLLSTAVESITVESPSHHPLPSTVHCRLELPLPGPLLSSSSSRLSSSNSHRAAVHRPSLSSIHCHCHNTFNCRLTIHCCCALNHCLSSGWLSCLLSSRQRLPSTGSGVSTQNIQPFSDARHFSLTCWEAACIVLKRI